MQKVEFFPADGDESARRGLDNLLGSILLIPGVLSGPECDALVGDVDRNLDDEGYRRDLTSRAEDSDGPDVEEEEDGTTHADSLGRVSISDASVSSRRLSDDLTKRRILPLIARKMPRTLENLDLAGFDSPDAVFEWAANEPTVNRYCVGGRFDPHRDGYSLTVVILLSDADSFGGGGTRFFESTREADTFEYGGDVDDDELVEAKSGGLQVTHRSKCGASSVVVKPQQGTAILIDGAMNHARCPVTSGVRHICCELFDQFCWC